MGGASIGAGGTWPPTFRGKRNRAHNLGIIHIWHIALISYRTFTLMSTPQTYELGWFSHNSNILSPTGQKVGGQNLSPDFQNRGAAVDYIISGINSLIDIASLFYINLLYFYFISHVLFRPIHDNHFRYPSLLRSFTSGWSSSFPKSFSTLDFSYWLHGFCVTVNSDIYPNCFVSANSFKWFLVLGVLIVTRAVDYAGYVGCQINAGV